MEALEHGIEYLQKIPLHAVLIAVCVMGLAILCILVAQARGNGFSSLKRHRSQNPASPISSIGRRSSTTG